MKKKIGILLLCLIMIFSMTTVAFATEDETEYLNFGAEAYVDNDHCKHLEAYNVVVKISKEGMDDIVVPLTYDDYGCYVADGNIEGLDAVINEVKGTYDEIMAEGNSERDAFAEHGYTVEVIAEAGGEEHVVDVEQYITLMTAESFKMLLDMIVEVYEELLVEMDPEYVPTGSFEALIEAYRNALLEEGCTEEEINEELAEVVELQDLLNKLESGEFAGELWIDAYLYCNCPTIISCDIVHEFYNADGEWVDTDYGTIEAEVGSIIKVSDIEKYKEYNGVKYEFVGAYQYDPLTYELDLSQTIDEFEVLDYWDEEDNFLSTAVCLMYEEVDGSANDDDSKIESPLPPEGGNDSPVTDVPPTGDDANLGLYVALMLAAAYVMKKVKA